MMISDHAHIGKVINIVVIVRVSEGRGDVAILKIWIVTSFIVASMSLLFILVWKLIISTLRLSIIIRWPHWLWWCEFGILIHFRIFFLVDSGPLPRSILFYRSFRTQHGIFIYLSWISWRHIHSTWTWSRLLLLLPLFFPVDKSVG